MMKSLVEAVASQRADEQIGGITTLRLQKRLINCLECRKQIQRKRHKFGLCTPCLREMRARLKMD